MEAAFIFYINSLFTVPFLCIFIVSILILILSLANSRGERKVKNMIPIVIISGVLALLPGRLRRVGQRYWPGSPRPVSSHR